MSLPRKLPNRVIVYNPFYDKPLISYGILAFCLSTQRWLLVKRRHSPEIILLVRGSYRYSEVPRLVAGLSTNEIELVKTIDHNYDEVYRKIIYHANDNDLQYAKMRYSQTKHLLTQLLEGERGQKDTEWLWPKGRMCALYETPHACALREFEEEAGIKITSQKLLSPTYLSESFRASNGRIYETRCWVYLFDDEIFLPTPNTSLEIGERAWMSEESASAILNSSKFSILLSAKSLINT